MRRAYQEMIRAYPGGWDAMSAALGYSRNGLENRVYERKNQQVTVHDALQMQEFSQTTRFAEAVATASGGAFVRLPEIDDLGNDELLTKFQELQVYLGKLSGSFIEATADGCVTKKEKQLLSSSANDIHRTLAELMAITYKIYCREEQDD